MLKLVMDLSHVGGLGVDAYVISKLNALVIFRHDECWALLLYSFE